MHLFSSAVDQWPLTYAVARPVTRAKLMALKIWRMIYTSWKKTLDLYLAVFGWLTWLRY